MPLPGCQEPLVLTAGCVGAAGLAMQMTHRRPMPGEAYEEVSEEELPDVSGLSPVRRVQDIKAAPRRQRDPVAALTAGWGYDSFRPFQQDAVRCALDHRDCLVVLPTGGGKSVCYQVPAACGAGLVLVVSPLIALMDDQVAGAREAGLRAGALHGNLDAKTRAKTYAQAMSGDLDVLYVSPERLSVGDLLPKLAPHLALLAVDEAHCVSHWGHDFRPEYRQLKAMFAQVPGAARMALTATATPQVQDDICTQLGLRTPSRLIGHIDRPNLVFRALPRHEAAKQIADVIKRHPGEGGIVYAQTRKEVERIAARLTKDGVTCKPYHAGLDANVRAKAQSDFVNERLPVVVATVAFGMGIDRSNVRYVVHANCPKSVEHYQQEAGRAGRDGLPAECVLLFSTADLVMHRALAEKEGRLPPDRKSALERQLRDIGRFAVAPVCRHRLLCEHFGQAYPAPGSAAVTGLSDEKGCGACDVCLGETQALADQEALITAQKILSAVWRMGGRWGVGQVVDVLRGDSTDKVRRAGHDQLPTFGLLKEQPETVVRAWIDQLAVQGHLTLVEEDVYTFITLAEPGRALCKGQGEVRLGRFAVTKRGRMATPRSVASAQSGLDAGAASLFERLRELRRALAGRQGVPPYLVFSDATLRGIAAVAPSSLEALRAVKGVGDTKLARYGAPVLAVVAGREPMEVIEAGS